MCDSVLVMVIACVTLLQLLPLYFFIRASLSMRLCPPTHNDQLTQMLGEAFNPRYMSIDTPDELRCICRSHTPQMTDLESSGLSESDSIGWRRVNDAPIRAHRQLSFKVKPGFRRLANHGRQLRNESASSRFLRGVRRPRRSAQDVPWKCETVVEWLDLGQQFFPRYIRQSRCSKPTCWYDFYRCLARAFTVRVLRRVSGPCAAGGWASLSLAEQPVPRPAWVFEEIAVNFCCECVP